MCKIEFKGVKYEVPVCFVLDEGKGELSCREFCVAGKCGFRASLPYTYGDVYSKDSLNNKEE